MDITASLLTIGGYLLNRLAKRLKAKVDTEKHAAKVKSLRATARKAKSLKKKEKALAYWAGLGNEKDNRVAGS